jgi:SAM-dependent methyltransferase
MRIETAKKWIKRASPAVLRADISAFISDRIKLAMKANAIVSALYTPLPSDAVFPLSKRTHFTRQSVWRTRNSTPRAADDPLPLPPKELLYYGTLEEHLTTGQSDSLFLRQIFDRLGLQLNGISIMDWGCRDGRVLRHFASEAKVCDFWGVDQDGACIEWAKENFAPPFKFATCSAYPHLPFEDRTFNVIFGISVFTHISALADTWLLELRRILVPGGYGLFSVHDEHTWEMLSQHGSTRELFQLGFEDIANAAKADLVVVDGSDLESEYINVFHSRARILREWGQYFQIVSIDPGLMHHQSVVVLRKPT